ncbi:MAG: D-alanine--D-alanine ligase, partial [Ruminococcaceae bacterium]|nr:D-alanine--D-alanine ligase [Oscillospiraceae bacterium]
MKTRVAVLFGGRSVEHEVSIISGLQALGALDTTKYEAFPLYISKDNAFYVGDHLRQVSSYRDMKTCLEKATRVMPVPGDSCVELWRHPAKKFGNNVVAAFDVAIPVVHGTNVEDGTLMGYLELLGIPYASCDVTSSALGMDKYVMKAAL